MPPVQVQEDGLVGLVTERANRLAKSVVPDLTDPFRVADLDEGTLDSDPARLADEAQALSMTGGRRVVRVRGATNSHTSVFEAVLDQPVGDALIVAEGGDLNKSSSLRKLFTEADNAAAIACYPDTPRDLADVVRSALKAENLAISAEALDDAVSRLGSDRGVTRRELDKLILYAKDKKRIELEDIRAIMGDEAEARSEEMCDAAGEGDFRRLDIALERLWVAETSPIAVVRTALGHFQQPRRRDVFHVERRILAHDHGAKTFERACRGRIGGVPRVALQIRAVADNRKAPRIRLDIAARPRQMLWLARMQRMSAPRGFGHHRVGRILVDPEAVERVGDKENIHEGPGAPVRGVALIRSIKLIVQTARGRRVAAPRASLWKP